MWLKTALTFFLIILDVVIFPFSCSNNKMKNEMIFVIEILDEAHNYTYYDSYVEKISKPQVINFPEEFQYDGENYEIIGWYIYLYQDLSDETFDDPKLIEFPYSILEEDYLSYYRGHRGCVVIKAVWEYTGNAVN